MTDSHSAVVQDDAAARMTENSVTFELLSHPRVSIVLGAASCLCSIEQEYLLPSDHSLTTSALGGWVENWGAQIATKMDTCSASGEWLFPPPSSSVSESEKNLSSDSAFPHYPRVDVVSFTLSWSCDSSSTNLTSPPGEKPWSADLAYSECSAPSAAIEDSSSFCGDHLLVLSCLVTAILSDTNEAPSGLSDIDNKVLEDHCMRWLLERENRTNFPSDPCSDFVSLWRPFSVHGGADNQNNSYSPARIVLVRALPTTTSSARQTSLLPSLPDESSVSGGDPKASLPLSPSRLNLLEKKASSPSHVRFRLVPDTLVLEDEWIAAQKESLFNEWEATDLGALELGIDVEDSVGIRQYDIRIPTPDTTSVVVVDSIQVKEPEDGGSSSSESDEEGRRNAVNKQPEPLQHPQQPQQQSQPLPRWKSAIATWIGLYPTLLVWLLIFRSVPNFLSIPWPIQTMIVTLFVVPTMSFFTMYNLIHWIFWRWMFGARPRPPYRFCAP